MKKITDILWTLSVKGGGGGWLSNSISFGVILEGVWQFLFIPVNFPNLCLMVRSKLCPQIVRFFLMMASLRRGLRSAVSRSSLHIWCVHKYVKDVPA